MRDRGRRQLLDWSHDPEGEEAELHAPPGRLERVDHVVNARVVPGCPGGARAAVRVRDLLERSLMCADAFERHALEQRLVGGVRAVLAGRRGWCRCGLGRRERKQRTRDGGEKSECRDSPEWPYRSTEHA